MYVHIHVLLIVGRVCTCSCTHTCTCSYSTCAYWITCMFPSHFLSHFLVLPVSIPPTVHVHVLCYMYMYMYMYICAVHHSCTLYMCAYMCMYIYMYMYMHVCMLSLCFLCLWQGHVLEVYLDDGRVYTPPTLTIPTLPQDTVKPVHRALARVLNPRIDFQDHLFGTETVSVAKSPELQVQQLVRMHSHVHVLYIRCMSKSRATTP